MIQHHGVGAAEPVRCDRFAVRPHDRGFSRKARHMAALAGDAIDVVDALLPFVIGALDRHTAERVSDVVARRAKIRARVQRGIDSVVIRRKSIFARAELGRFAVRARAQHIGAVIEPGARADVVAGLAIDPRHGVLFGAVFNRGAVDLRVDLPGGKTDRGMAAGTEVVDLALGGRAGLFEQSPVNGFVPGLGHHRRAPLLVDLGMAGATDLGVVEVLGIQHQVAGGIRPVRKERHRAIDVNQLGTRRFQPLFIVLIVIALGFVRRHQRYCKQTGQNTGTCHPSPGQARQHLQHGLHTRMLRVVHGHVPHNGCAGRLSHWHSVGGCRSRCAPWLNERNDAKNVTKYVAHVQHRRTQAEWWVCWSGRQQFSGEWRPLLGRPRRYWGMAPCHCLGKPVLNPISGS
ncbi:hypothetical protein D3C79_375840 [compost metagenome]